MRKLVIAVWVLAAAASSANCANSGGPANSIVAPLAPDGADARKPGAGNRTDSALSYVIVTDSNLDDLPNWGESVTFNVRTEVTTEPLVSVACYQDGVIVLGAAWPSTPVVTLASGVWRSGAADCTAVLYYFEGKKEPVLAELNFRVE